MGLPWRRERACATRSTQSARRGADPFVSDVAGPTSGTGPGCSDVVDRATGACSPSDGCALGFALAASVVAQKLVQPSLTFLYDVDAEGVGVA